MPSAQQHVRVSIVPGDDHYKRMSSKCGTLKNPHCSMAKSAEHRSNLQPFPGGDDVFIWVKNSQSGMLNHKKYILLNYQINGFFHSNTYFCTELEMTPKESHKISK